MSEEDEDRLRDSIGLGPNDAALILRADGYMGVVLPQHEPGDEITANALTILAIAQRMVNDPVWMSALREWFDERLEQGHFANPDDFSRTKPPVH